MKNYQVVVVGGGASGMVAAITAARAGLEVAILEKLDRVGKKILATGNGKCNFTNMNIDMNRYHGKNRGFAKGALKLFDVEQTLQFFETLGITHKVEKDGRIMPYSDQASAVLDVLRMEMQKQNIEVICDTNIVEIRPKNKKFHLLDSNKNMITAQCVVVAIGGNAAPAFGTDGSSYRLLKNLGHELVTPFPALVQIVGDAWFFKRLKGVRIQGNIKFLKNQEISKTETGEILFTEDGLSGIPVFQISRMVGEHKTKNSTIEVSLDLFPEYTEDELLIMLQMKIGYNPERTMDEFLIGTLNKKIIPVILKEVGIADLKIPCQNLEYKALEKIAGILKDWRMEIIKTRSWRDAQVTAGGISTKDIEPKTLESKLVRGIYIVGEAVDIDGDCGGFNLQWAWSSGVLAGLDIEKKFKGRL